MERFIRNILSVSTLLFLFLIVWGSSANINKSIAPNSTLPAPNSLLQTPNSQLPAPNSQLPTTNSPLPDTIVKDSSIKLRYPIQQKEPYIPGTGGDNPLYLKTPKNVKSDVEYDPKSQDYILKNKIDTFNFSPPEYVPFQDYMDYDIDKALKDYWKERAEAQTMTSEKNGIIPKIKIASEAFDRIFGGSTIDIRPQGSAELTFGVISNRRQDPALSLKQQRITNFDFQEKIQMSINAKIGDKINLGVNYNTEAAFDFENKMKLGYEGKEDEIIKSVEAGNISLPLNNTLIKGSQSLFGFKTKLQFGKVYVTSIFSEQQSKSQTINVTGGAQISTYSFKADQYEDYRHYFISQYFRDNYEKGLSELPIINSNINITRIEVWITNIGAPTTDNRSILAMADLGEEKDTINIIKDGKAVKTNLINNPGLVKVYNSKFPYNDANDLYKTLTTGNIGLHIRNTSNDMNIMTQKQFKTQDYAQVTLARRLNPNEYTFNPRLGFISLNQQLNSGQQVLAVAYQYQVIGTGKTYQVGEFSDGGYATPNVLIVKLLQGTSPATHKPLWNLMMKNVYSLGAYQVNKDNFILNVQYTNNKTGTPVSYLLDTRIKGMPLISKMGLDRLDQQLNKQPDGVFDFIDNAETAGGTIQTSNGRIFFPVLEPFGLYIRNQIDKDGSAKALADVYAYDSLYTQTKIDAQQLTEKDKYVIQGSYKAAGGSEINLNAMNIPQGSVKVTAGGIPLTENVDFTVDYALGRVKIINEGLLNSGSPISISLENNSLFSIQNKTLMGTRVEYVANKDLILGGTLLHLTERPLTQKVNLGEEPISNTIWGMDVNYQKESTFITSLIDKLPFYNTKAPSHINLTGEFANLIPGHSNAIGKNGTAYIDDFEGSTTGIDLTTQGAWKLASTPHGQADIFPEGNLTNSDPKDNKILQYGFNRAKLAWYMIDPLFQITNSATPSNITSAMQSNAYSRAILQTEVFPNVQTANGQPVNLPVLNLSYYPAERGPYNYDAAGVKLGNSTIFSGGLNSNGKLRNPDTRWGGITRYMTTTDFNAANIEYIEFWMMDPFIGTVAEGGNVHGGHIYFNLGDISEDLLKDGQKSFENGLPKTVEPITANSQDYMYTQWGRVSTMLDLVNSFDNVPPEARTNQDVGLDGLSDANERAFFSKDNNSYLNNIKSVVDPNAYDSIYKDPSADDYRFFLNYTNANILERYKNYNGTEGNSPVTGSSTTTSSATNTPDNEDINLDNTLNQDENYYQYKVDLDPNNMKVGSNYISDVHEATNIKLRNGSTTSVKWYQFKIPIRGYQKVVGNIQDFSSIRFMRIFLRGFQEPVNLRFATLELLRSEWREYTSDLISPGEYVPTNNINNTSVAVGAVNLEENGSRPYVNYVIPPGIQREINWGTTNMQQLNEQSLDFKICNLIDGDARAVYKTSNIDIRKYGKIQMFVHEEKQRYSDRLKYGDLTAFIRIGTDFTDNFYEYEVPLTPTAIPASPTSAVTDPNLIWPSVNDFIVDLGKLTQAKENRNIKMRQKGSNVTLSGEYIELDGANKIRVVGLPNLGAVNTIMLGVRNPKKTSNTPTDPDDGQAKCADIWFDELRLTDFNQKGGWAAMTRANITLADLGNLTLAGNISTPNFGSLEQNFNTTSLATTMEYDVATNLELGKFLGQKSGIHIPMHFDYSQTLLKPEYDPLNPDILFKNDINDYNTKAERDSVKNLSNDLTTRKNLNFTNVKKNRTGSGTTKPQVWDIENFDFTYAYSEFDHHNADIQSNIEKKYRIAINYNYVSNPKKVSPFAKSKIFHSKLFALIHDFNFYYFPKAISFHTDVDREFTENLMRNKTTDTSVRISPTYTKFFNWTRSVGFKWDLAQSLKIDFQASTLALVDEPPGAVSNYTSKERDTLRKRIYELGRKTNYNQRLAVNYTIPINKVPFLDWITANAVYTGEYHWIAPPQSISQNVGNIIENGNNKQLNANANLSNLYNKIPYLKKLFQTDNNKGNKGANPYERYKNEGVPKSTDKKNNKTVSPKIDSLKTQISALSKELSALKIKETRLSSQLSRAKNKNKTDSLKTEVTNIKSEETKISDKLAKLEKQYSAIRAQASPLKTIMDYGLRVLTSVKTVSLAFTQMNGITLPGFTPTPGAFGQDWNLMAPGTGFVFGDQHDIRNTVFGKGLIADSATTQYITKYSQNLSLRATIEPIPDLRIEISATRNISNTTSSYLRYTDTTQGDNPKLNPKINPLTGRYYNEFSQIESGNFTISWFSWSTAFTKTNADYSSKTFQQFMQYTYQIAFRLAQAHWGSSYGDVIKKHLSDSLTSIPNPNNNSKNILVHYPYGYGLTSQNVLLQAFLAAYSGKNPNKNIPLFPTIPLPNWRMTYSGLTKIDFIKQYLQSITVSTAYQSTYSIGNYTTNPLFVQGRDIEDAYHNYLPNLDIGEVNITEQFAPLINLDMVWVNSLLSKIEIRKSRNVSLSFANSQITEIKSSEIVIGLGYRIKDVVFYFKGMNSGTKKKKLKSDINLKANVSIRNNESILRNIALNSNQVSAGQQVISVNTSADYQLSDRFTVRVYFDKTVNNPFVSSQFPNSNTDGGIALRFTLAQ